MSWLGEAEVRFPSGSAPKMVTSASLRAPISPSWHHVGDPSFWRTVTLGVAWTGANRLTIAYVALASPRETACSTSPASSSSFLLLYARTAPLTSAVCDFFFGETAVLSHSAYGPRAIVEENVASAQQAPKFLSEVNVFVFSVVGTVQHVFFFLLTISASMSGVVMLLCTTRLSLSPESKKHVFFRTGSILPFLLHSPTSVTVCTLFPQVICPIASVFPPPDVAVSNVHVCILARPVVCGHEIQNGRQACGSQLSLSHGLHQFGV